MEASTSKSTEVEEISEESGWTIYFEDFLAYSDKIKRNETEKSTSLISDAASKCIDFHSTKKLSFKKRRKGLGFIDDHSLEDAASSPVNSPKVSEIISINANEKKDKDYSIQEERNIFENCTELKNDTMNGTSELKKRGLCLVPVSMFVDYHD